MSVLFSLVLSCRNVLPALILQLDKVQVMRYGENPHQQAAFYREHGAAPATVANASLLQGKAMSFNNVADADAALECVKSFAEAPACVIVKHANPCGVALGAKLDQAYERAFQTWVRSRQCPFTVGCCASQWVFQKSRACRPRGSTIPRYDPYRSCRAQSPPVDDHLARKRR